MRWSYLEHALQLGGQHHVALGLQLAGHERLLPCDLQREEYKR